MVTVTDILRPALDWVLPERCPCCGMITTAGGPFCVECWKKLFFINSPWCSTCALPMAFDRGPDALCINCLASPPGHDGVRAVVKYDELSAQVIMRLKYGGKIGLADMIARQLVRHLPEDRSNLIVAPVPLHWTRMWSRTFNQSALIAKQLSVLSNLTYAPDLLVRKKRTPSMRGLDRTARRKAVGKAFAIHPNWAGKFNSGRIILVDDVLTTGATSDGCVTALKKGGAGWVQIFCWARALRGEAADADATITLDA